MSNRKTPHTEAELATIFKQDGINGQYFPRFYAHYTFCFNELYDDYKDWEENDWEGDDSVQKSALTVTRLYIKPFLEQLGKGHGEEWAHTYAASSDEGEKLYFFTYTELLQTHPELAKKELLILAKSFGEDKYFEKHYLQLFEDVADPNNRIEVARSYSKAFQKQVQDGRSEVYAHEYADLISEGEYHKIYCEEYAFAYDEAHKKGKSEKYARIYSERYASALTDIKRRHGISDDEEMIDHAIDKVTAYMNAWEYVQDNPISDFDRFAYIYENVYLNFDYSDNENTDKTSEEINALILKKTLERFQKK